MRQLLVYYFIIFVPFLLLLLAVKSAVIGTYGLVALLFCYVLYRQFTDVWRLVAKGIIEKATWKTLFNPFLQIKYFKELYWIGN